MEIHHMVCDRKGREHGSGEGTNWKASSLEPHLLRKIKSRDFYSPSCFGQLILLTPDVINNAFVSDTTGSYQCTYCKGKMHKMLNS